MMLHKLRRAMVNVAREPLRGEVEIDEAWIGGPQAGLRGSRQLKGRRAALVLVAVEKRGKASGRLRMAVITDFKATTLSGFIQQHIAPGSTIYTDALKSFTGLAKVGYRHIARAQPKTTELRKGAKSVVPLADRAIGNLQQWLIGTYHGVSRANSKFILMSSFSAIIGVTNPWRLSRLCSVWEHNSRPRLTAAFAVLWIWKNFRSWVNTTYCSLLKQPYKQETSSFFSTEKFYNHTLGGGSMKFTAIAAFVLVFATSILQPQSDFAWSDDGAVRIMTQNLYQGTNFAELLSATTPFAFATAVMTTRENILATKPSERAAAIAREIARDRPDLVALQEATILRSALVPATTPPTPVTNVEMDQLATLLAELDQLGHRYHVVAILPNLDAQAPSFPNFGSVRITVRTAIIARSDPGSDVIRLSNIQAQEYLDFATFTTPLGVSIPNQRGWTSVDVRIKGREFRFITTHLDQSQAFNSLQISEVLQSAVNSTALPIVFVGDFNVAANVPSDPSFANYQALLNAGLIDAWVKKRVSDPGLTCCQTPSVSNVTPIFTFRVDLVLLRGDIGVRDIHLVGNTPENFVDGVWPSDHAGMVATLQISNRTQLPLTANQPIVHGSSREVALPGGRFGGRV